MSAEIPLVRGLPFVGSLFEIDGDAIIRSLTRLSTEYGPIFRITVLGQSTIVLGSHEFVSEVCDESRFGKKIHSALQSLRPATGDGLFTAHTHEHNWEVGHRILMPAFGPLGIRGMFPSMLDIARQMMDHWERHGPEAVIDVPDAMTRLTLDTLALCAFDHRLNSFYRDHMHPFVDAMVGALNEAMARERRPNIVSHVMLPARRRFEHNVAVMHEMADSLVHSRRKKGLVGKRGDLLDAMLDGVDPHSGERLSDENIRFQLVTFLIAGHETTSGLLSFAVHLLLKHTKIQAEARAAIDSLLGGLEPTIDDLARLPIIEHILMETLRLWPTAPAFAVTPHKSTTIGSRYSVAAGEELLVLLPALHRDRTVWGDDADEFRPDRFQSQSASKLPSHSWKPFGNGARACIGRGFAMQEAQMVLIMLLQRFEISACNPDYALEICETLTMKPDGLHIYARARPPLRALTHVPISAAARQSTASDGHSATTPRNHGPTLRVFHGGNSGSCSHFAQKIVIDCAGQGMRGSLDTLDHAVDALTTDGVVVIVAASYEGQPADNARSFVTWVEALDRGALAGCRFALLGLGNRQWASTYQAIPKRIYDAMIEAGARPILDRGEVDAGGEFVADAEDWIARLMEQLSPGSDGTGDSSLADRVVIDILPPGPSAGASLVPAVCTVNVALTAPTAERGHEKRHIELALPANTPYRIGDTLAVLPNNPPGLVKRLLARIGLSAQARVVINDPAGLPFPLVVGLPVEAGTLFASYVELGKLATIEQLRAIAMDITCPLQRQQAERLLSPEVFRQEIVGKGITMLDLLERFPSATVNMATLLLNLPPMAARRYSISSAPAYRPDHCSLTVSVLDAPALQGAERHLGAASNMLADLTPGTVINVSVLAGNPVFVPPQDSRTPLIMIAAGSGIAPFRAFIQQRQIDAAAGKILGPAILFFGCRHPEQDFLYHQEMTDWKQIGKVDIRPIFSRQASDGERYVQHLLHRHRGEIVDMVQAGAHVYVCGDAATLVPAVEEALITIAADALNVSRAVARRWVQRHIVLSGRYAVDAFT